MGKVQIWQDDKLGTDKGTLETVIRVFKEDGIQSNNSKLALKSYINGLDNKGFREMLEIDEDATMEIIADCYSVRYAALKYREWKDHDFIRKREEEKQEERLKREELYKTIEKKNKELELIVEERDNAIFREVEAREKIKELEYMLALYKADLFDFYEQAGKIPKHERREME